MLFRIVEKLVTDDRRNFAYQPGIWHLALESARKDAARIASTCLAHRLFICGKGANVLGDVIEEVELSPLGERMRRSHVATLQARDPQRLRRERAAISLERLSGWDAVIA
jgi:hypothetical protein